MACRKCTHDNNEKLFTGLIVCGDCGRRFVRKYTHAKKRDRPVWICLQYFRYGTSACHSQRIPEAILIEKTKEVLGVDEITRETVMECVSRIYVPEHNHLIYELKDGSTKDAFWKNPSRSQSWTEEMKQAAREKALERARKEKNGYSTKD